MKKCVVLFAAIAALSVSCQKEPVKEPIPVKGIEKTFTVLSPETRTTLDGMSIKWAANDEINVVAATTGNQYTFTLSDGAGSASASFTGTLAEEDAEETTFYAIYPNVAIRHASLGSDIIEVDKSLGDTQTAVKDGFDSKFAVMTAVIGEDGKISFRHGAAFFKVTIGNEDVVSVNLKTSNTRFAGRPKYVASTGEYSGIEGAKDNITLAAADGTLEYGATYFIPVLCKDSNLNTLTLTYTFRDGTTKSMSTDAKSKVKLKLGYVYNLGTPSFSLVPEISAKDVVIEADATSGTIGYSVVNPIEGEDVTVSVEEDVDWIFDLAAADGMITFNCTANTESEPRTAVVTLSYQDAEDVEVTVRQKASGGVSESHVHVFYYNSSSNAVNLTDGETGSYFTVTAKTDLGGDYAISEWTIGDYISTKGVKMNSDGKITFTTSSTLTSTLQFYFIRRKSGDSSAKIQLVPANGDPVILDTPYDSFADSGVLTLEKGTGYTIQRKDKEQAVLLVIVNENE